MQGIELKEFQIDCVNKLLDATTVGNKKEILVQAPTGSGKTIILLDYIQEYIEENKNDTNNLEKLYKYFDKGDDDVLLVGIKMNRADRQIKQNIDFLDEL